MANSKPRDKGACVSGIDAVCRAFVDEQGLDHDKRWYVAFSGGLDSTVLLHAMRALHRQRSLRLYALHANHGLQPTADNWQQHCIGLCTEWGIPCISKQLQLPSSQGRGLEACAREARYRWFADLLKPGEVLLTAHHRDDQAETVLANLVRGAGVHGLAAMPARRRLAAGLLLRPLLDVDRSQLYRYALEHGLRWVDDETNAVTTQSRNFLRHTVLPHLQQRWPGAGGALARTAGHMQDAAAVLDELATEDLAHMAHGTDQFGDRIYCPALIRLSAARQRLVLRHWFRSCGFKAPDAGHLQRLINEMVLRPPSATAVLRWPGVELRRYRDWLYLAPQRSLRLPSKLVWHWQAPLPIPALGYELITSPCRGEGLARARLPDTITVRWRRGGERIRLPGRRHHHALKKLLQAAGVPPWQRAWIPLLYVESQLAAVAGHWYCQPFAAGPGEAGVRVQCRVRQPDLFP